MPLPGILGGFETYQKQFFHIFGAREKIKIFFFLEKSGFFGKYRYLSEKIGIYRKNRRFFFDFFTPDFSIPKSFPAPPKSDFSQKNRPKSAIFCSMVASLPIKEMVLLPVYYQPELSITANRVNEIDEACPSWMTPIVRFELWRIVG